MESGAKIFQGMENFSAIFPRIGRFRGDFFRSLENFHGFFPSLGKRPPESRDAENARLAGVKCARDFVRQRGKILCREKRGARPEKNDAVSPLKSGQTTISGGGCLTLPHDVGFIAPVADD
jgi:hypothetical protein